MANQIVLLAFIIGILALAYFATGGQIASVISLGGSSCDLVEPTWSYYSCDKSQTLIQAIPVTASTTGNNPFTTQSFTVGDCTSQNIAPNALSNGKSCQVTINSFSYPQIGYNVFGCSVGVQTNKGQKPCSGSFSSSNIASGDIFYLDIGQYVTVYMNPPLYSSNSVSASTQYYTADLYIHTSGNYVKDLGVGCNIQGLVSSTQFNQLPSSSLRQLSIGQTQPFVDGYQSYPTFGNTFVYQNQNVIAVPQGQGYVLYSLQNIQSPIDTTTPRTGTDTSTGTYTPISGQCLFVPNPNPIATVQCVPGSTLAGYQCVNFQWQQIVNTPGTTSNQCVTASDCFGGTQFNPTTFNVNTYSCQSNTCVVASSTKVQCYPPQYGCQGNAYCDTSTYTCKASASYVPVPITPTPPVAVGGIDLSQYAWIGVLAGIGIAFYGSYKLRNRKVTWLGIAIAGILMVIFYWAYIVLVGIIAVIILIASQFIPILRLLRRRILGF